MDEASPLIPFSDLHSLAVESGLFLMSVADASDLLSSQEHLIAWQQKNYAGEMEYMQRSPALLCSPSAVFPKTASILVFAIRYSSKPHPEISLQAGKGKVARYAWGRDYHRVLKKCLKKFVKNVEQYVGDKIQQRTFTDAVPLLERALGARAGLGFAGKNTMLIQPGVGSFFFLAEVLWNVEVVGIPRVEQKGSCGSCTRCLVRCPTAAFVAPGVLDARKCISYLTIEKRGVFSVEEGKMIGEWIFGCDICQDVCPFNHVSIKQEVGSDFFELEEGGAGPILDLSEVLGMREDSEFLERFQGTAIMRTGRVGLLRNAACVAANTGSICVLPALKEAMHDSSEIVRLHASRALEELRKNY